MTDENFAAIVTKPDNVPIVGMVYLLGFFTWLATWRAVQNDERMEQGLEPLEALDNEKVLVWPDLVYTEMICMVALTALLILWGLGLRAPLEEAASSVKTPNPSKAPWYFLGLQEMLVYFDPWMAGVVLPTLVIVGLMAIPFLDYNKAGNGYYTIKQRQFAYIIFQLGFLELWIVLIVLGDLPARSQLELLRSLRAVGPAQSRGLEQRRPVPVFLGLAGAADADRACAGRDRGQIADDRAAGVSRHCPHALVSDRAPSAAGLDRISRDVRSHGGHPLHRDVEPVANYGHAAYQDDAEMGL